MTGTWGRALDTNKSVAREIKVTVAQWEVQEPLVTYLEECAVLGGDFKTKPEIIFSALHIGI